MLVCVSGSFSMYSVASTSSIVTAPSRDFNISNGRIQDVAPVLSLDNSYSPSEYLECNLTISVCGLLLIVSRIG